MTPSPQGTTPSQAPAMSREEWARSIGLAAVECGKRFRYLAQGKVDEEEKALTEYRRLRDTVLDAIMSLQAEVKSLQDDKILLHRKVQIAWDEYAKAKADAERLRKSVAYSSKKKMYWGKSERQDTVNTLRLVCEQFGDNDWPDDLHLGDVIEKHLERNLLNEKARQPK